MRQEKSNSGGTCLRGLRLRLPQRPVVLSGGGSLSAAAAAARPPWREKLPSAPLQMASSAARRGERSGSGGQACGGASVKSAVRGGCRLLHKKPLHISGDGRGRCVRPSGRRGWGWWWGEGVEEGRGADTGCPSESRWHPCNPYSRQVLQRGGSFPKTHTRTHSVRRTHSHTHTHARTCAHAKDAESLSSGCGACSLVSGQLQRVDRPGESLQGITARQPTLVSFSSKSPYEYFTPISASTSQ